MRRVMRCTANCLRKEAKKLHGIQATESREAAAKTFFSAAGPAVRPAAGKCPDAPPYPFWPDAESHGPQAWRIGCA